MTSPFETDQIDILADKARAGQISRRRFTQLAVMLMGTAAVAARGESAVVEAGRGRQTRARSGRPRFAID